MIDERVYGLLGLAARAGQLISGDFEVERQVHRGKAVCVLLDSAASENTKKHYRDACDFREIPLIATFEEGRLGQAIGKDGRKVAALKKGKLAEKILSYLQ